MTTTLLIPGLLCDAYCWEPVLERLPAQVADLSTQDSLTDMARDLLAQNPGPLRVAGHSMGARVAIEMTRLAPERIEKLALLDTGIHPLKPGEPASRAEIVKFAYDHGMQALAERWLPPMVWTGNQTNAALMADLTAMVLRMNPDLHARQIKALVERPDATAAMAQITCPVLLMVGRYDQWSPVAQHEDMLALLPDAQLDIIEDAGHFAPVERPDAVADRLVPFLRD
ncbi:alpha/beta fold hydrolase [Pararhodobacter zhoushanensis]|uniref:alpha/beta fold hydrolase n=1 Tax=Pararhodobacter zhoushanensis TaxID=2479545 RepID=UPI000F8F3A69|nr:alpha/beta hydrolase [Pararhodobacter zhoushanensis]